MATTTERCQKAKVVSRKDHAEDLWSIRVRPEQPLAFKPGQYATLGVEEDGRLIERAYSILSSPLEDAIEFFFELVPQGKLTPLLYKLHVGDTVVMRREAKGLFGLDKTSGRTQHYLVCTVTGVAPYVSIVRTLARERERRKPPDVKLVLLQAASRSWEFGYRHELEALTQKVNWLHYLPTVSRPWEDASWKGDVGRIEDILRKYLDSFQFEPSNTTIYLCGHPQMIENAKGILKRRGFPREFIREETYWIPKKQ